MRHDLSKDPIVIVEGTRTPMGSFQSSLYPLKAPALGAVAVRALLHMTDTPAHVVDDLIMGHVLQAGNRQSPARQVALKSALPETVSTTTINKVCGSGLKAIMMGAAQIMTGESEVVVAGGMESMSNAPLLLKRPFKKDPPPTNPTYEDHLFYDGLFDAYEDKTPMGLFAEAAAEKYGFSREDQDAFAIRSLELAQGAEKAGHFEREIAPILLQMGEEKLSLATDEPLSRAKVEKIPHLKPAFKPDGTITAANASALTDGAAAVLLMRESHAKAQGLTPRVKIIGYASAARAPKWFTLAPIDAIQKLLAQVNWTADSVDLFEINEAFAVVAMAAQKELGIPAEKLNVHGGACALGHPLGASGARLVVSLMNALEVHNKRRGIAALCIGGGEGVALAIERL